MKLTLGKSVTFSFTLKELFAGMNLSINIRIKKNEKKSMILKKKRKGTNRKRNKAIWVGFPSYCSLFFQ
jgi:hypothetical protein